MTTDFGRLSVTAPLLVVLAGLAAWFVVHWWRRERARGQDEPRRPGLVDVAIGTVTNFVRHPRHRGVRVRHATVPGDAPD